MSRGLLFINAQKLLAPDARVARLDERRRARRAHGADEFDGEFVRHVNHVEQDAVAFFQLGGIIDEQVGQFFVTRIGHNFGKDKINCGSAPEFKRAAALRRVRQTIGEEKLNPVRLLHDA